ncbi:hypothetical protein D9757_010147 [Collybiopsis confluens]|uniref:DUF6534 domain-containing protein n=1 Tax=Collybiopsis confluens TaxID=2823264 RepID=A0A8H5GT22_9AGAR|nr:hypothetical protein D9757_010147 [Collybiopsis confluens]
MADPTQAVCLSIPVPDLRTTYGAMLIGVIAATFLQGFLTLQAIVYFDSYPSDSLFTKITVRHLHSPFDLFSSDLPVKSIPTNIQVAVVWSLDMFHLGLISQSVYHYLVNNWGNLPALQFSTWELDLNLTFIALSAIVCQGFFLRRIWMFSKRNFILVGLLTAICITTLALDLLVTVQITTNRSVTEFGKRKGEIIAVFTSGAVADVALALSLCYYIRKNSSSFERTKSVIRLIVRYTVTTGLITSLLGLLTLVAYFASPDGFIFIAMHFSLGRMYTNALLATLNSRQKLRATLGGSALQQAQSSRENPSSGGFSSLIPWPHSGSKHLNTGSNSIEPRLQVLKSTQVFKSGYNDYDSGLGKQDDQPMELSIMEDGRKIGDV